MDEPEAPLTDDAEILALLGFEPVVRKCRRPDLLVAAGRHLFGLEAGMKVFTRIRRKLLPYGSKVLIPRGCWPILLPSGNAIHF